MEPKMWGHHRARREGNILLARARSRALAPAKVGHTGHSAKLLLLRRVEHHLLERPLGKLLLLLLIGSLGEVPLLTKLRLLGKVRGAIIGTTRRSGRCMRPLELLLLLLLLWVLVLLWKSVLVRSCKWLSRQSAFSSRCGDAG